MGIILAISIYIYKRKGIGDFFKRGKDVKRDKLMPTEDLQHRKQKEAMLPK